MKLTNDGFPVLHRRGQKFSWRLFPVKSRPHLSAPAEFAGLCAFEKVSAYLLSVFLFFAAFLVAPSHAVAQAVFGSIVGTVTDPTGAVIPGATVTVTDVSKGISQTTTSNASGHFEVRS